MDTFFLTMLLSIAPVFVLMALLELLHRVISWLRKVPHKSTGNLLLLKMAGSMVLGLFLMGVVMAAASTLANQEWMAHQVKALAQYERHGEVIGPLTADETASVVQTARNSYKGRTKTAANICSVDSLFAAQLEYRFTLAQYNQLRDTHFAQREAIRCRVTVSFNDAEQSAAVLTKRFPRVVQWVGVIFAKYGKTDEEAATKSLNEWMAEGDR